MTRPRQVRLAELVASLSLATDLGLGQPEEHVLRQTVIATRLGALAGFSDEELASAFYVSLLAWVGCIADSHELAHWYGDDRQVRADSYLVDKSALPMMRFLLGHLATGGAPLRRVSMVGQFLAVGLRDSMNSFVAHCQTTGDIAQRLGIGAEVARALPQAFARWDGKGVPSGLRGEQIESTMRLVQIADDAEVFHRMGGTAAVSEMLQARRGTEFDPGLVDLCVQHAPEIFDDLDAVDAGHGHRRLRRTRPTARGCRAGRGADDLRRLRRPQVAVVRRTLACRRRVGGRGERAGRPRPGGRATRAQRRLRAPARRDRRLHRRVE